MGCFGVVFKGDISNVSEHVAIGITTGYLGSLTTFSGWNQKMLDLSIHGHWLFSALGFLIGYHKFITILFIIYLFIIINFCILITRLNLSSQHYWDFLGLFLVANSIIFGVETAKVASRQAEVQL